MRLVTCNIWSGRGADGLVVDPERLGRVLARLDADVLALQEVDRDQDRSGGADLSAVVAQACRALRATVATPFGAVTVVTTHLSFLPVSRTRQLRRLARALPREGPLVLLGDLNLGLRAASRATGLAAEPVGPTFPADSPVRQIDHLLRRGLPPPSYAAAVHTEVSDHRAVVADW